MNAHRRALEILWKDQCSVYQWTEVTDPETMLTDFQESPLLEDQPCKLSFETLTSTNGDEVATAQQVVKLFLSPDVKVPAGCKIIVTRPNDMERTFTYARSGEPGVFSNHQEIMLEPFRGWA